MTFCNVAGPRHLIFIRTYSRLETLWLHTTQSGVPTFSFLTSSLPALLPQSAKLQHHSPSGYVQPTFTFSFLWCEIIFNFPWCFLTSPHCLFYISNLFFPSKSIFAVSGTSPSPLSLSPKSQIHKVKIFMQKITRIFFKSKFILLKKNLFFNERYPCHSYPTPNLLLIGQLHS